MILLNYFKNIKNLVFDIAKLISDHMRRTLQFVVLSTFFKTDQLLFSYKQYNKKSLSKFL